MTRPQQVTRSEVVADRVPVPRDISRFFWSACLVSSERVTVPPNSELLLAHEAPRHATNGLADFDTADFPSVSLVVPRDGVYALSYSVQIAVDPGVGSAVGDLEIYVLANSGPFLFNTVRFNGESFDQSTGLGPLETLNFTRVGLPLDANLRLQLKAANQTEYPVMISVVHFEATYLGPLGEVYNVKGPN